MIKESLTKQNNRRYNKILRKFKYNLCISPLIYEKNIKFKCHTLLKLKIYHISMIVPKSILLFHKHYIKLRRKNL